ncbi:hypothetical protein HS041_36505 [Planomonospora sp. ID67723]|uniref:hypothetical protein n=1 Tax=Planomonospora sp. ID67723 TaxID=2738134 RepID=UPI0018C361B6|nr:hypothetical protein [Planomonospora sp. ID67723]MBG0833207.1 hypothetical protein [Planomonospora sp. ID67723]
MRRWIAVAVAVAVAATVTAAGVIAPASASAVSAHARPDEPGPVAALKSQFVAGHGVRFREKVTTRHFIGGRRVGVDRYRVKGVYRFGRSGVVASRLTHRTDPRTLPPEVRDLNEPVRIILLRKGIYLGMEGLLPNRPRRTSWLRLENPGLLSIQMINVLEPATLRGLLATTRRVRPGGQVGGVSTTRYQGTITARRLYAVSPTYRAMRGARPRGLAGSLAIRWRLWQDAQQNTRKLTGSYTEASAGTPGGDRWRTVFTSTATFRGWGAEVRVKAPPARSVINFDDPESGGDAMAALPRLPVPVPGRER